MSNQVFSDLLKLACNEGNQTCAPVNIKIVYGALSHAQFAKLINFEHISLEFEYANLSQVNLKYFKELKPEQAAERPRLKSLRIFGHALVTSLEVAKVIFEQSPHTEVCVGESSGGHQILFEQKDKRIPPQMKVTLNVICNLDRSEILPVMQQARDISSLTLLLEHSTILQQYCDLIARCPTAQFQLILNQDYAIKPYTCSADQEQLLLQLKCARPTLTWHIPQEIVMKPETRSFLETAPASMS